MSSPPYAAPLLLEPAPPRPVQWASGAVHAIALVSLALVDLPPALLLVAAAAVLASLFHTRRRLCPPRRVIWDAEGHWLWAQASGTETLWLLPDSFRSPYLVILNFADSAGRRRRTLILPRGSLEAAVFRRLRVRLERERSAL